MNRIAVTLYGVFATAVTILSAPAWGQAKELVCYSDVFAPYVIVEGPNIRGIDVDTVTEAGKRVGIKVSFKTLPWVRLEREIALGNDSQVECAFAYTLTPAREAYMDFTSSPIKLTELVLFARRGSFDSFHDFDMLKGKSIGIRRGFKVPAALATLVSQGSIKLEEVNDDLQNFEKLKRGRLDAVLSNHEVGDETIRQMKTSDLVALSPPVLVTPTYLVFNKAKNLSTLVPLFNKGLKAVMDDGTHKKIRARYRQ